MISRIPGIFLVGEQEGVQQKGNEHKWQRDDHHRKAVFHIVVRQVMRGRSCHGKSLGGVDALLPPRTVNERPYRALAPRHEVVGLRGKGRGGRKEGRSEQQAIRHAITSSKQCRTCIIICRSTTKASRDEIFLLSLRASDKSLKPSPRTTASTSGLRSFVDMYTCNSEVRSLLAGDVISRTVAYHSQTSCIDIFYSHNKIFRGSAVDGFVVLVVVLAWLVVRQCAAPPVCRGVHSTARGKELHVSLSIVSNGRGGEVDLHMGHGARPTHEVLGSAGTDDTGLVFIGKY